MLNNSCNNYILNSFPSISSLYLAILPGCFDQRDVSSKNSPLCNTCYSGWFDPHLAARYGIADFDWSTGREIWANEQPMDNAGVLIRQAAMVKAVNPNTHVWVYRNLVKALSWYEDVGAKLSDPAYSGWFLRFDPKRSNYSSPPCTEGVCSTAYHSQDQTPEHLTGRKECKAKCDCGAVPCGEYLWDHRNASLREWLVSHHVMGALGMANENVSGFYFDDYWVQSGEGWSRGPAGLPVKTAKVLPIRSTQMRTRA